MAKIRWVRAIETATCGKVAPGDVSDVIDADAERYVRNGWATPVVEARKPAVKPVKKTAQR